MWNTTSLTVFNLSAVYYVAAGSSGIRLLLQQILLRQPRTALLCSFIFYFSRGMCAVINVPDDQEENCFFCKKHKIIAPQPQNHYTSVQRQRYTICFPSFALVPVITVYITGSTPNATLKHTPTLSVTRPMQHSNTHRVRRHAEHTAATEPVLNLIPGYIIVTPVYPLFDWRRPRDAKSTPSRSGTLYQVPRIISYCIRFGPCGGSLAGFKCLVELLRRYRKETPTEPRIKLYKLGGIYS